MKNIVIYILMLASLIANCQVGFNESYDLGQAAAAYGSIELSEDTLVVFGIVINEEGQGGLLVTKLDTFGSVLSTKTYFDSLGGDFGLVHHNSFVKLSDNKGYAGIGKLFQKTYGLLALFDNFGVLNKYIEYPDNSSIQSFYRQIIIVSDGFLILGSKQDISTYNMNVFALKTDFEGNKIWEKKYPIPNRRHYYSQILILNENEYVISSSTTSVQGVALPQVQNTSRIFAIDSLGIVKWAWESQPSLDELGAGSLFKTPEGNWAYTSGRGRYNEMYNEISVQPKFVIRDADFNIIRSDTLGVADVTINYFSKAIQMNDGGWLAIGVKPVYYPLDPFTTTYNSLSGWFVRLDGQGNQLWSRTDTAFWSSEFGSSNYLYDAVELPSGSIVACGYSRTYDPAPKDWGWLIKISKDGCVDVLDCALLKTNSNQTLKNKITLFPNPTQSILNIETDGIYTWDKIEIVDVAGRVVKIWNNVSEGKIDLNQLGNGIYFLRLTKVNQSVSRKVVKSD
jgi:hypothetical protein